MSPTIFVNIASYRDPECFATVTDLLAKARHPEAITVGLVSQPGHSRAPSRLRRPNLAPTKA